MDAYTSIRNSIIHGDYEPGQRLTEEFLAAALNISRTPIREAIRRLETEGLVNALKRGVTVREFTEADVHQIYDLRALLEGYAASRCALFRSDDDLVQLAQANNRFEQAISKYERGDRDGVEEVVRYNGQFHDHVLKASNNDHIHFLISKVVVLPLVFRSFYWYDPAHMQRSFEAHQTILKAIAHRDADWARSAMAEHIYRGRDHVVTHLNKTSATPKEELL